MAPPGRRRRCEARDGGFSVEGSYHQPPLDEFFLSLRGAVQGDLPLQPIGQFGQTILEGDLRLVTEDLAGEADVGEAVPDVADAVFARNLGADVVLAQSPADAAGDFANGARPAAADVEHAVGRIRRLQ